jgi:hypothetical protein
LWDSEGIVEFAFILHLPLLNMAKDDEESLLPNKVDHFEPSDEIKKGKGIELTSILAGDSSISNRANFLFKCYVIASMVFLWTGYTIMVGLKDLSKTYL